MTYLVCRNRVADFARWRNVFASHEVAHLEAGLRLLWLGIERPNNVFFTFEVSSMEKAQMFISNPEATKAALASGVIDGEYHFVEDAGGYR